LRQSSSSIEGASTHVLERQAHDVRDMRVIVDDENRMIHVASLCRRLRD